MAKLQSGVLENFSGSIGDLNFYKWKNKFVIRGKRTPTKKPPTEGQILAREKFRLLGFLYRRLVRVSGIGFQNYTNSMTDKNAFFKYNHSAIIHTENGLMVNYPGLVMSSGNLNGIQIIVSNFDEGVFSLKWKPRIGAKEEEKVYIILLSDTGNRPAILSEFSSFKDRVNINLPVHWKACRFFVYAFVVGKKESISNSQFVGEYFIS